MPPRFQYHNYEKERQCIMCGEMFPSTHAAHRRCDTCANRLHSNERHIGKTGRHHTVEPRHHGWGTEKTNGS